MKDIRTLHNEAMDLALQGDIASQKNAQEESLALYTSAFEKEREAALLADFMQNPEPGLSILYRSAASLAIQCGRYREAEQLIAKALSGNPTNEIAHELRELLQDIYAQSGQDEDVVIYKLEVPNKERTRFESILNQLGLTTSKMRKVIGNVALL
jgi:tetratricopeptide (TPR) repeat protein